MCSLIDEPPDLNESRALRSLYQSVILQAFKDAVGSAQCVPECERRQARVWLLGNSERLKEICAGAGYAVSDIHMRARRLAHLGWSLPPENPIHHQHAYGT